MSHKEVTMGGLKFQKILVISTLNWMSISNGFTYGHMTSIIQALQKKEDDIVLEDNEISFIAASITLCSITGLILLAFIGDRVGRRWSFILFSIPTVINWIVLLYARDFVTFLVSRFFAGLTIGGSGVLCLVGTAEYTSPKSRAFFTSMVNMVTPAFSTGLGHVLGVVVNWRSQVPLGIVLGIVSAVLPFFWVESPQWLASKERYVECEQAFRKLHGSKMSSEKELQLLIEVERNKQQMAKETNTTQSLKKLLLALKKRYFWDLMVMNVFVFLYYAAAGKVIFSTLATVILEEMTGSSDVFFYTLLVDGYIFVGTCASCILLRKMSIRNLLFSSGFVAIGFLLILSACLYFKNEETYFQWINIILLAFYFIIVHAGPYPILDVLLSEMFPLELKLYCFLICSPIMVATIFLCLLFLPSMVSAMGYHGLFLLNSGIMCLCLSYLWIRLPETKGKTLQEIEVYFKTSKFDVEEVLSNEQMKALV